MNKTLNFGLKGALGCLLAASAALIFAFGTGSAFADGDAEAGKKVFNKCKACHGFDPAKKKIVEYFQDNFWITTAGNFRTQTLIDAIPPPGELVGGEFITAATPNGGDAFAERAVSYRIQRRRTRP